VQVDRGLWRECPVAFPAPHRIMSSLRRSSLCALVQYSISIRQTERDTYRRNPARAYRHTSETQVLSLGRMAGLFVGTWGRTGSCVRPDYPWPSSCSTALGHFRITYHYLLQSQPVSPDSAGGLCIHPLGRYSQGLLPGESLTPIQVFIEVVVIRLGHTGVLCRMCIALPTGSGGIV
jgi:hypothetical protein